MHGKGSARRPRSRRTLIDGPVAGEPPDVFIAGDDDSAEQTGEAAAGREALPFGVRELIDAAAED